MKEEIEQYLSNPYAKQEQKRYEDPGIKYCPECKYVWEFYHFAGNYFFKRFPDMPTYGLERKICTECAGEEMPLGRYRRELNQKAKRDKK